MSNMGRSQISDRQRKNIGIRNDATKRQSLNLKSTSVLKGKRGWRQRIEQQSKIMSRLKACKKTFKTLEFVLKVEKGKTERETKNWPRNFGSYCNIELDGARNCSVF